MIKIFYTKETAKYNTLTRVMTKTEKVVNLEFNLLKGLRAANLVLALLLF